MTKLMIKKLAQDSDKRLLALIAQGNKTAFSQLMHRYLNPVILFVMRYFDERSDAEDIAQETFIRLWCKAPNWQEKGISVKAWLFKVAYHQCIDRIRKQKPEHSLEIDLMIVDETACLERLLTAETDLAMQKIALDSLPERQRTALLLCAVRGLSNKEAAEVLDVSVDALESLLARGRRKLKQIYAQSVESQDCAVTGES